MDKFHVGWIGESFIIYKLALLGIFSQKLPSIFDHDILVEKNLRIEIKTSTLISEKPYKREYWAFRNQVKNRKCDFYCFVCLDKDFIPSKIFIVPSDIILNRELISIPKIFKKLSHNKFSLKDYENKWKFLTNSDIQRENYKGDKIKSVV